MQWLLILTFRLSLKNSIHWNSINWPCYSEKIKKYTFKRSKKAGVRWYSIFISIKYLSFSIPFIETPSTGFVIQKRSKDTQLKDQKIKRDWCQVIQHLYFYQISEFFKFHLFILSNNIWKELFPSMWFNAMVEIHQLCISWIAHLSLYPKLKFWDNFFENNEIVFGFLLFKCEKNEIKKIT